MDYNPKQILKNLQIDIETELSPDMFDNALEKLSHRHERLLMPKEFFAMAYLAQDPKCKYVYKNQNEWTSLAIGIERLSNKRYLLMLASNPANIVTVNEEYVVHNLKGLTYDKIDEFSIYNNITSLSNRCGLKDLDNKSFSDFILNEIIGIHDIDNSLIILPEHKDKWYPVACFVENSGNRPVFVLDTTKKEANYRGVYDLRKK